MPFPLQSSRPYTRVEIETLVPGQLGVYGIFSGSKCVYIGRGELLGRLLGHLEGDNGCITISLPTHWVALVTDDPGLERALIREYRPSCNPRAA